MNAEYNFTGAARTRTINLGGPRGASAAQLAASARAERALRQAERDRARSATLVQAVWRGRTEARRLRAERAREFAAQQHVVQRYSAEPSSSQERQLAHVRWLRLLCAAKGAPEEGQLLRTWSETMVRDEALFAWYTSPYAASWSTLIRLEVRRMLARLGSATPSAERNAESLSALSLLLRLCDPKAAGGQTGFSAQFAQSLMADSLYPALHAHLTSFPVDRKASPTLQPAVDLSLVPVTLQLPGALQAFVLHILAVPHLPARVPLPSLARLAADLPLLDVLRCIDPVPSTPHLLANLIALSARRVPQLKNAAELSTYLDTLAKMQDALPRSTFEGALEGTAGSTAVPDVHLEQSSSSRTVTDAATHKRLSGLVAPSHLTALMTASTRYSSSRPALTRFLVSTLEAWPASARDRVFSATLFGSGPPNGLVRELWRGWVRGGPLAKAIGLAGHGGAGGARAAVATIDSAELAEGWGPLLLLVELYSRVLLTLGDDEFRPPASAPGSSAASAPSRNPLTLDEIVTFSALLRTMSFSLYWLEGSSGLPDLSTRVPGFRLTRMELRSLFTNLLRQIHARDARKRFAPEGHWLMTSEMDLNSFIQTVMLEEDELAEPLSNAAPASDDWEMHDEFDDAEEDLPVSSRLQALRRAQEPGSTLNARQLAFLSPRLGVLNNIPFTIPFELRVEIFRQFIYRDHERRKRAGLRVRHTRTVRIRRSEVAHDGFLALNPLGAALKDRVLIEFIDDWGNVEAGIDGGGLFKEFLTSLISQAFDTNRGLWLATEQQELYPNPHAYAREPEQLEWYKFLGRVLGKALYMGILVDIKFARFFLSKWLGRQGYLDDLASLDSLDPVMYRGLLYLKNYDGDVEADLALNFTVQSDELGHVTSHDLIPGGSNIPVTRENRLSYIYRVSHYRLTGQISRQCDAFFSGLSDIIDPRWLRILDVDELKVLVCGTEEPIDLADLRANTELGGYDDKDEAIEHFWAALHTFTPNERRAMLKFVTSCPSPPLLGFSELRPKFGIRQAGNDDTRLPTASTCVNLLKLPRYTSVAQTREKLLYAIHSGAGFDLS